MSEIGLFEAIHSMRAMRRLKPAPVPLEVIERVLAAGTKAPSGQNTQPWRFVVVRDPETKQFIGERYHGAIRSRFAPFIDALGDNDSPMARNLRAALYLAEHFHETPVLLHVCGLRDWPFAVPADRRVGKAPPSYGSVYPAIQNILLACRGLGLGASLTTMHQVFEGELAARLGVPDEYGIVAILPIGYPKGNFGPVTRQPVAEVAFLEHWGDPFAGAR